MGIVVVLPAFVIVFQSSIEFYYFCGDFHCVHCYLFYLSDCIAYKISVAAVSPDEVESFDQVCDVIHTINSDKFVSKEQLLLIAKLPHEEALFNCQLKKALLRLKNDPIFSMLDIDQEVLGEYYGVVQTDGNPEVSVTYYNILCLMSNGKCYLYLGHG